ncbi:MAG: hypothetical protein CMO01_32570 [Thalassobius sp.]|nr:hypothetical protein [Thalassovita sp.]
MKHIYIFLCYLLLLGNVAYSQEAINGVETERTVVKQGRTIEEYDVLLDDKKVKHGQYIKYELSFLNTEVPVEIGYYDHDKRTGLWYFFTNKRDLQLKGTYKDGLKSGLWEEYYQRSKSAPSLEAVVEPENNSIEVNKDGLLVVNTKGLTKSSVGAYKADAKSGIWYYYSTGGELVHMYDHSKNELLFYPESDSTKSVVPYLGGKTRFFEDYSKFHNERVRDLKSSTKSIFRISSNGNSINIEILESYGDKKFTERVQEILSLMPNDWIYSSLPCELSIELAITYNAKLKSNIRSYEYGFQCE